MTATFSQLGNYGRFGNQLFQIASTVGIAEKNNHDFMFTKWEYSKYFENELPSGYVEVDKKLQEATPYYHECLLEPSLDYDLIGYFQSYKYFEEYKDLVDYYFTFKNEVDIHVDYVSIHVRRGDYLYLENHPVLPMEYYNSAMSLFPKDTIFLICSDDINWCKENFTQDRKFLFSSSNDLVSDFIAMKHCSHNIISNSSFSWWSAYLNNSHNKKVIAPSIYVNNETHTNDRYPEDWLVI